LPSVLGSGVQSRTDNQEIEMARKIEQQMIAAIRAGESFKSGNTEVVQVRDDVRYFDHAEARLYGNVIARVLNNGADGKWTLAGWNTATTRSRINAMARAFNWTRSVYTKHGLPRVTGLDQTPITSTEWVNAI
jgi:hypothetical protein